MSIKKVSFKGATTEIFVPRLPDFSIDYSGLEKEIQFQVEAGIQGLFVNGLATECLFMDIDDQASVLETTVKVSKGKVPVMANIMVNSVASSMELLKKYEQAGADAICITQPMVYPYTEDGLYNYFSKLITSTKLPVYIYNAPQSSNTMSPGLVAKLINENDNVCGYKDSTQNVIHLQTLMSLVKKDFEFIAGSDGTILPTLLLGGVGIISLISVVFPKPIIDLCDAYFKGDYNKARELQFAILEIREVLKTAPFLAGYKYAADLAGYYPGGPVMPPLGDINDSQRKYIKENLEKLELI